VFKRFLLVVVGLAVVFGGIFGWKAYMGKKMAAMMSGPRPPAVIASADVTAAEWVPHLDAVGSLVSTRGVEVNNEVAGQVKAIQFSSGQSVRKGDVLIQLDDEVDQADLQGLVAQRHLAELQYERTEKLFKEDQAVPRADYDEARAKLDNARAAVVSMQALIAKKRVRAPFAGLLGIRQVNPGQYLPPGSAIVMLQALDPIHADFSLPEQDFPKVAVGQKVEVRVRGEGDRVVPGAVSAINPGLDPGTRNVRVRATLPNPDGRLRPGMFAEVRVILPTVKQVLTVPQTAVFFRPYGDSVFVIQDKDGARIAENRPVTTGEVRDGFVEVVKGLAPGDKVVSAGHQKLRNGQNVKVDNSIVLAPNVAGP
jgi:membrane fusion protein (multidrug efflux system)